LPAGLPCYTHMVSSEPNSGLTVTTREDDFRPQSGVRPL